MFRSSKQLILAGLFMFPVAAHAASATPGATKTYTLSDLRQSVSNHKECSSFYKNLKQLTKKPVSLQFTGSSPSSKITAKDASGQIENHSHAIVKQEANGSTFNRVVSGEFTFGNQEIDYVAEISANLDNKDHQYAYPIILASHDAQCYFTALVKPSDETVAAFKKSIQAGHAAKGTDIHQK